MSDGILTIDYNEPAYVCFAPVGQVGNSLRYCSKDEIRRLLIDLGLITDIQLTSGQAMILRIPVQISETRLKEMRLAA